MKKTTVVQYISDDGRVFTSESAALQWETNVAVVKEIEDILGPRPDLPHGGGYWQHTRETVRRFWGAVLKASLGVFNAYPELQAQIKAAIDTDPSSVHPGSIAGRIMDDTGSPLQSLWSRMMCIDPQYREWDQPYFALNPGRGEDIRLGP